MKLLIAVTLLAVVGFAAAECPEGCNGHGFCGEYDKCSCWRNWQGNSCNERVCPFDLAYVDIPHGDLNMDGSNDKTMATQGSHIPHWRFEPEVWPSHGAAKAYSGFWDQEEDGHFYAECSNKGMCDRKSGLCSCFDGFEGTACRRTVCPNECSGHGTCETMEELAAANSVTYTLWDRYKMQMCVCDPQYFGIDCSVRHCPYGDDPLTTNQYDEVQYVEVHSEGNAALGGTFRLTYVDEYGETWDTNPITAQDYQWTGGSDSDNTDLASAIAGALTGIPNSVFETVSVTVGPLDYPIPGAPTVAADKIDWGSPSATDVNNPVGGNVAAVFPDGAGAAATEWAVSNCLTGSSQAKIAIGGTVTANAMASGDLATAAYASLCKARLHGFRATITFTSNPGNINNLGCDTAATTGGTIACSGNDVLTYPDGQCGEIAASDKVKVNIDLNDVAAIGDRIQCGASVYTLASGLTAPTGTNFGEAVVEENIGSDVATSQSDRTSPALALYGRGTKELVECSHRGLCDFDAGLCQCFNGYTHDDCSRQDALMA
jgi:hypothetical protein